VRQRRYHAAFDSEKEGAEAHPDSEPNRTRERDSRRARGLQRRSCRRGRPVGVPLAGRHQPTSGTTLGPLDPPRAVCTARFRPFSPESEAHPRASRLRPEARAASRRRASAPRGGRAAEPGLIEASDAGEICGGRAYQRPATSARGRCRSSIAPRARRGPSPPGAGPRCPSRGSGGTPPRSPRSRCPRPRRRPRRSARRPPPARRELSRPPGLLELLPRAGLDRAGGHPEVVVHLSSALVGAWTWFPAVLGRLSSNS
jgi:hypothetical protein